LAVKILVPVAQIVIFALDDFNCYTPPQEADDAHRRRQRDLYGHYQNWQYDHTQSSFHSPANHHSPHM
jgi:hypothetical protein